MTAFCVLLIEGQKRPQTTLAKARLIDISEENDASGTDHDTKYSKTPPEGLQKNFSLKIKGELLKNMVF